MRNGVTAAVPVLIALVGGTTLGLADIERMRLEATRVAVTHVDQPPILTEEEQDWLAEHNPFGIPQTARPGNHTLVVRQGYSLSHDNVDLIADWVSFHLTKEFVEGTEKRPGSSTFKPDPRLLSGHRAEKSDYKGWKGVYDRGHQCASGDSKGRGKTVIRESFYLSNTTPQSSRLNQQKWRLLEARIQELARTRGELWVITGPAFVDDDADGIVEFFVLGRNRLAIPTHYFKIVYAQKQDGSEELEAMAFLVPNQTPEEEIEEYLVSINEIELQTGYDFLADLPDTAEEALEAAIAEEVLS